MRYFVLVVIYTLFNSPAITMESTGNISRSRCCTITKQLAYQRVKEVSGNQTTKEAITSMLFDILKIYETNLQSLTLGLVGGQSLEEHLSKHISDETNALFSVEWTECEFGKKTKLAVNTQLNPSEHFKTLKNPENSDITHKLLLETLNICLKDEDSKPFYPLLYHLLTSDVVFAKTTRDNTVLLAFAKGSKFSKALQPKYEDLEYPFLAVLKDNRNEPGNFTFVTAYYNIKSVEFEKELKLHGMPNPLDGSPKIDIREWTPLFGIGDLSALHFCLAFLPREILTGKYGEIIEYLFSKLEQPIISYNGLVKPIRIIKALASCRDDKSTANALLIISSIAQSKSITGEDEISNSIQEAANDSIDSIALLFISSVCQCLQFDSNGVIRSIKDTHTQLDFSPEEKLRALSIQNICRLDSRITDIYHIVYISMLFLNCSKNIEDLASKTTLKTCMRKRLLELLDHIYKKEMIDDDVVNCISVFKQFINGKHDRCIKMVDNETRTIVEFSYVKYEDIPFSYKILGYSLAKCVELNKTIAETYIEKMLKTEETIDMEKYEGVMSNIKKEIGLNLPFLSIEYSTCAQAESEFLELERLKKQADKFVKELYKQKKEIDSQIEEYREKVTQDEITAFKEGIKSKKTPTKSKKCMQKKTNK